MRVLLLLLAACSGTVETGDYVVTSATSQETGAPNPSAVGLPFTVSATDDGIAITEPFSLFIGIPADIPRSGDGYHVESYATGTSTCEAGGTFQCRYSYSSTTVTAPSTGTIRVEMCRLSTTGLCSATPSCGDAAKELSGRVPCQVPYTVDGKRTTAG